MKEKVDSLKDLLLSAHVKINVVKDITKETGADVAHIRLRFDQIVKEAIKIATKVQASSKSISTSLTSRRYGNQDNIQGNLIDYKINQWISNGYKHNWPQSSRSKIIDPYHSMEI
ncbi:hypothetical protein H5410_051819 [Solanum commersonii]|uniref:Uncharacterized protein n=1 Tax=Solanum commersonii TaxID=4109 RepID=A0A9J5X255_SOLCO|nr:hypothetical protein H5410_051819 [Solanum commersonii]